MKISARWVWIAVVLLLALQAAQVVCVVHRESPTWDEGNHIFAGYGMWRNGDYGLNPEHSPLVKLLATLPLLGKGNAAGALRLAREAVAIDPAAIISQTALGDAAAALGLKDEARKAWQAALDSARQLEADAQTGYLPDLETKLRKF